MTEEEELQVASDPQSDPESLNSLAKSRSVKVRRRVVVHPSTSAETLLAMVNDPDWVIRFCIHGHRNRPTEAQGILAKDPFLQIRLEIFSDLHLPYHILKQGIGDPDPEVRKCIANHPLSDRTILTPLARDRNTEVSRLAEGRLRGLPGA